MAIKFQTNVPQTLCFPYGDFMEVNGQYGQQFLYTVEAAGQRDRLYATPTLHQDLQTIGIIAGDILTITKVEGEGNRKSWKIEAPDTNGHPPENPPPAAPMAHAPPSNGSSSGSPPIDSAKKGHAGTPSFENIHYLAHSCLQTSLAIWSSMDGDVQFSSTDIRKFAISLFMECNRRNIYPQPEDADLPF